MASFTAPPNIPLSQRHQAATPAPRPGQLGSARPTFTEPTYAIVSPGAEQLSGQETSERIDRLFESKRQFGITPAPSSFVQVTNMQGGLFVQFLPSTGAEGYEVTVSADIDASNVIRRETWNGTSNTEGFVPVGNLDQELFVQVRAYAGDKFSEGFSQTLCGSTIISGESSPIDPADPETPPSDIPDDPIGGGDDDEHGLILT